MGFQLPNLVAIRRISGCHQPYEVFKFFTNQNGISKNRGFPPKWMVNIMENPIKMDDLGGKPTIFGNTQMLFAFLPAFQVDRLLEPEPGS